MKKILLLLCLFPAIAYSQKFELSALAGSAKYEFAKFQVYDGSGFSGQISLAYYPVKRISLGINYDISSYKEVPGVWGGFIDYHLHYFLVGVNVGSQSISDKKDYSHPELYDTVRFNSHALSVGAHIGIQVPLSNKLFLSANVTVTNCKVPAKTDSHSIYYVGYSSNSYMTTIYTESAIQENITTYSFFLGLSYRI